MKNKKKKVKSMRINVNVKIPKVHCLRCGWEWIPRKQIKDIKTCAKCNNPYWNERRVRKKEIKE
ncbi:MAG: hypothetical protein AABY22_09835 [Nanoarchaeota archaeon]